MPDKLVDAKIKLCDLPEEDQSAIRLLRADYNVRNAKLDALRNRVPAPSAEEIQDAEWQFDQADQHYYCMCWQYFPEDEDGNA